MILSGTDITIDIAQYIYNSYYPMQIFVLPGTDIMHNYPVQIHFIYPDNELAKTRLSLFLVSLMPQNPTTLP